MSPRSFVTILAWIVAFPIAWPGLIWRSARHERRHRARAVASRPDEGRALAEIRRIRAATLSTRSWSTIASGPDEETFVELDLDGERLVVPCSSALAVALAEAKVPTRLDEGRSYGIGALFGWAFWVFSVLAWSALVLASWPLAALAGVALLGLFLLFGM